MKSAEIRQAFLDYFSQNGHEVVASSSLVPGNDPTLLFTNAGMVQFKDVFLGQDKRSYSTAASSQRCVRAGGKHNDLENVGYTARHHTFFEMLGNFSFGDYFKREAIQYAWEFLTETLKLPKEKLWITVHVSDDEAADIWINEIGVDPERFSRLDEDNFWQMGDTGPCGPSSEIFYDHGESVWGGPPGSSEEDGDRYIEIWNLVFMQYERQPDGEMKPLPNPSIDTGMGLERIAAVMQGVHNNYDIDLFQNLLKAAANVTGCEDLANQSLRVIADHIRSCAFLITDGVLPSNEGRGYVLRRIIRRALRHGNKLGTDGPFFHKLVDALSVEMGDAYPELRNNAGRISKTLLKEEEQFARTLDNGLAVLNEAFAAMDSDQLSGEVVFRLYDTYGFPTDLTNDIAREQGKTIDMQGYEACMEQQRQRARAAGKFDTDYTDAIQLEGETRFSGYEGTEDQSTVVACYRGTEQQPELNEGDSGILVLEQTPFYAESGGQVGDSGYIESDSGRFEVSDCVKQGGQFLHKGVLASGKIGQGESVRAVVDADIRRATALNHSATHLLHAALREVLGEHVTQRGSLVDSQKLRFDFSHDAAVTPDQLSSIESIVNDQIRANSKVLTEVMAMDAAIEKGAMALFGEKYSDEVRVLTMGDGFSVELCGGTHVSRTGDIGLLKFVNESGIAAGVRRIEAITGEKALQYVSDLEARLAALGALLKSDSSAVVTKTEQLLQQNRTLARQLESLKLKLAGGAGGDLMEQVVELSGVKYLGARVDGADPKSLRDLLDQMKSRIQSGVIFLVAENEGKVALICGVTKDLVGRVAAGNMLKQVAPVVGGKGGGRPDMAQGGGTQPEKIDTALEAAKQWLAESLTD